MISLLLFNNFYPVTSYRRVQKEKKATSYRYTVRSVVMVRAASCQREGLSTYIQMELGQSE